MWSPQQHASDSSVGEGENQIQWNPSITATLGEQNFGRYIGVAFIEGLFCTQSVHLGPVFLAILQRWPLRGVPL